MTTHDYPGESNSPAHFDPATASTDPGSEQSDASTTAETSMSPTAATDPGWQRQADEFAENRSERAGAYPSPAQADSANSTAGGPEGLDDDLGAVPNHPLILRFSPRQTLRSSGEGGTASKPASSTTPNAASNKRTAWCPTSSNSSASGFAEARSRLEQQWSRGEQASTEDLRVALKRYREFFDRLLAV